MTSQAGVSGLSRSRVRVGCEERGGQKQATWWHDSGCHGVMYNLGLSLQSREMIQCWHFCRYMSQKATVSDQDADYFKTQVYGSAQVRLGAHPG
jgi:hypothetical protein